MHSAAWNFISTQAWMLHEPVLRSLGEVVQRHARGDRLDPAVIAAIVSAREQRRRGSGARIWDDDMGERSVAAKDEPFYELVGTVAVIPVEGVICKYADMINGTSQPRGITSDRLTRALAAASVDNRARSILLQIDSPGGTVAGGDDMLDAMARTRARKPVVAYCHDLCASGGYLLASQSSSIYANPSATVGSMGVYCVYQDSSKAFADEGITSIIIRAGVHKGMGEPGVPISDEQVAAKQELVDALAAWYVDAVAKGRGMIRAAVQTLATGRVWTGTQAVELGLVDGVTNITALLERMNRAA